MGPDGNPIGPELEGEPDPSLTPSDRERMAFNQGPGPPIQMSANDQGPDGANLFCFHIPNWCSNRQLYDLFTPHGAVISCRIFVDKISGRSRGFGFVSFDRPESANSAIEHMNGYELGHKRLKVEIKRSKRGDRRGGDRGGDRGGNRGGGDRNRGGGDRNQYDSRHRDDDDNNNTDNMYAQPPQYSEAPVLPPVLPSGSPLTENLHGAEAEQEGEEEATTTAAAAVSAPNAAPANTAATTTTGATTGATAVATTAVGMDALHKKLWKAAGQGNLSLVETLHGQGASLTWNHPGRDGQTAMHHACQFDQQTVVTWMIQRQVDMYSVDFDGNTSLHVTAMYGHVDLLRMLIQNGTGNVNTTNGDGQTPMDLAKIYKKDKTIMLLDTHACR